VVSKDLEETTSEVNDDNIEGDESVQDAVTIVVRKKVHWLMCPISSPQVGWWGSSRKGREGKVEGEGLCV